MSTSGYARVPFVLAALSALLLPIACGDAEDATVAQRQDSSASMSSVTPHVTDEEDREQEEASSSGSVCGPDVTATEPRWVWDHDPDRTVEIHREPSYDAPVVVAVAVGTEVTLQTGERTDVDVDGIRWVQVEVPGAGEADPTCGWITSEFLDSEVPVED